MLMDDIASPADPPLDSAIDAPEAPPDIAVARLDAAGVYQGIDTIKLCQLTPEHVPLPDGCDLPPGRYFWDREKATFLPISIPQQLGAEAPAALNALAWALLAEFGAGTYVPEPCLDWLDFYIRSVDFSAPGAGADRALLADYIQKRRPQ